MTNIILSQQNFCHDKHTFVATKDVFCVCRDKKMILVAALANDGDLASAKQLVHSVACSCNSCAEQKTAESETHSPDNQLLKPEAKGLSS